MVANEAEVRAEASRRIAECRDVQAEKLKTEIKTGDRISTFMERIGKGAVKGRLCVLLSDKYLKSPYCMNELFAVWRNCRKDGATFIDRTRVFVMPTAKINTEEARAEYVEYWERERQKRNDMVSTNPLRASDKGFAENFG